MHRINLEVMMTEALAMPVFDKPVKLLIVAEVGCDLGPAEAAAIAAGATVETQIVPAARYIPAAIAMAARLAEFDGFAALHVVTDPDMRRDLGLLGLQGLCVGLGASGRAEAAIDALHLVAISRKWAGKTKGIGFRA